MVGQPHGIHKEPVIAILEAHIYTTYSYIVCPPGRDFFSDDLVYVSPSDVISVEDFTAS